MKKLFSTNYSNANSRKETISVNRLFKSLTLATVILVAGLGNVMGQVGSYTYSNSTGTYTTITGTTWQSGTTIGTDAVSSAISLPWSFRYNGRDYSDIYISNNGFVTFGRATATTVYTPISLTSASSTLTNAYDGAISPFGANLVHSTIAGASPSIIYGSSGSDFVIQFTDMARTGQGATERFSFQIRLTQTTNVITFHYGGTISSTSTSTAQYPQVGLRGASYYDWRNLTAAVSSTAWSNPTAQATVGTAVSTSTIAFRNTSLITAGQRYIFTPPTQLATPSFASIPATTDFTTWTNGMSTGDLPGSNWRTWPSFGDRSWRINSVAAGAGSGWGVATSGAITVASPASGSVARMHSYNSVASGTGYMDYYLNFSSSSSTCDKILKFDYINTSGTDNLQIQLSTNGGTTFSNVGSAFGVSAAWATQSLTLTTSNSSTVVVRFLATSDYGTTDIGIDNVNVAVVDPPAQPSAIVGTLDPEPGSTQTYSVTNVSGVTYTWSFPATWTITGGQNTNSVTVTVGTANGTISVTPSNCGGSGTARTTTSTIPNYRWKYVSSSLGSATWTGGESRNIDITIKNTGVATWNTTYPNNIGVRWNSTTGSLSSTPWSDYHVRTSVGSLAPGAQGTFTLAMEARNSDNAPSPSFTTNLADGTYYMAFDVVSEGQCWFSGNTGTCGPGNTVYYSAAQTVASTPSISCSALTAFGNVCTNATPTNSFTISGVNLTNSVSVGSVTGYTYSTTLNGTYTSTLTLTPSSGSLNQTVYVKFTPTAVQSYSGTIVVSSTGATSQNVSATGSGIAAPTVDAGSDFNLCSGQTVALSASTNATATSTSASATYSAGAASSEYVASPTTATNSSCPIPLSVTIPSGAVITGVNVAYSVTTANAQYMNENYSYLQCTSTGGVKESAISQGVGGTTGTYAYTRNNLSIANGVTGGGTVNFNLHLFRVYGGSGCNTTYSQVNNNTFTITVNYSINPTYSWSPATGLSATNVLNPNCSATSTQTYTLTVTGTNGCSASDQVVATIAGSAPSAPTASVSGSSTINVGGTATLTSSAGANTVWYTVAAGGTSVGTGDNWQTPVQCTPGSVTYYAEDNNGTCASPSRTAVSFTVRPMVVSNPANGLICQTGGSVTLSTQLTGASGISWSPSTNLSTTSGASTVASPTTTTPYTMTATVAGCGSVSGSQTVGVIDAVAFTPTSTPASVCAGNTAELASNLNTSNFSASCITASNSLRTAPGNAVTLISNNALTSSGSLPSGVTVYSTTSLDDNYWSNVPIGFTFNYFGDNATTVFVGTNGTVVVNVPTAVGSTQYDFAGGFPNSANPAATIAVCARDLRWDQNASGTLKYWTEGTAPTRKFIVQYAGAVPFSGNYSGRQDAELVLNETTGIVEIYVIQATNSGGSPTAASQNKFIGLQDKLKTTGATSPNCSTNATNYWNGVSDQISSGSGQAWKFVPGANYTFQWATAGSNIGGATATTYTTPALNTPGTVSYSVAATNPNTQCTTTQTVNITVNALPASPVSSGNVTVCNTAGNQNLVVTTASGVTADWYAASTGGTVLTTPSNGTGTLSYSVPASSTVTYYAQARDNSSQCVSASRTGVTLNVNSSPAAPTVTTPVAYCQGATPSTLTATATGANTLNWYSAAPSYPAVTGATSLGSAPTPSTSTAGTTNYYVSQSSSSNSCESELALIAVTVNATPSAPVASNPSAYCQGASASALTATSTSGNTLYWYTVPTGGTGSTTAPTPSTVSAGTTDYYVADRTDASGCEGSRTTVTVTVNPSITASVSNSASSTSACGGGSITFTATPTNGGTPTYQWYLNGNTVGTNSSSYILATPNDADAIYVAMTPSAQTCLTSSAATNSNTVTLTSTASTPTVTIQSTATSAICPGTSVTFSVNSSANMGSSPTYVWKNNGTVISGATNPSYTTTGLVNNDQITLEMTSSLNGGCLTQSSATSAAISTTVNSATSITTQPVAASACAGTSANFSVVGAGQGTLTYQWKKNGTNITGNATATTSSLTLSGVGAGDLADYTVVVTGGCGSTTSTAAALTLNTATSISAQPVAVIVCSGLNATYNVTAAGQGTLSYQWRKDGVAISGATNASYTATGVTSANAGQYSVVVTGGCGSVNSSNAALTVQPGTVIATQPTASTICQNNTANFSVSATGQGTLSYQWKKDGSAIGGATSSTLAVSNAQSANAGSYTVDVTGGCGTTASSAAALTVNPATSITTQPVGTAGCEGQNTTFTVVAAGTGTLSYQWKYGSTNVGTNSASYNIPSTTTANDGNYSVVVTGGCGNATSSTVALNVYASPTTNATISTANITDATLCGKNEVTISANTPGAESTGEWSVVGNWGIIASSDTDPITTFTANNAALGGTPKQLVWSHKRNTSGNFCYTRDTITVDFKQPVITSISSVIQNGDVVWGGLTSSAWSTSDNWYQYQSGALIRMTQGEPTSTTKVYTLSNATAGACVSSSNVPALGSGEAAANVYVGTGATLNLSSGTLTIAGDFTNNGTINPGTGTVTFNGSAAQKITGTGTVANLNNVIVNKSGGTLTLEQPTRVAGTLTMTQGDIITDATNILEVGTSAASVGTVSWTAGTVRGPMKRWFATSANSTPESGIFPVGATIPGKGVINRYAQVNFSSAPGTGGYIVAEYKTGTPSTGYTGLPLTYNTNQYIQNFEEEGYWDITPYNSSNVAYGALNTAPYTLKLRMNNPSTLQPGLPPSGSNGNSIADISNLRIITSKGPSHNSWVLAGTQGGGQAVLASGDYLLEETGVTGFSFFNGGGNDNNPLPVELVSFSGACDNGIINLTWQTASEFNSSHFDVEKSRDGENWQVLTTLPSAGTSNELITYQSTDQNGTEGNNYFRLRQVDIDGTEKLYDPINVSCSEVTTGYFSSFPNPSGTAFQVVVNNKELIGTCTLNMVDASGKVIEQRNIDVKEGINLFVINQDLNPGIYFLNITNGAKSTQILRHAVK